MMAKVYEDITCRGTALFHRELLQPPKHKLDDYGKKKHELYYPQA